jgi:hypothetical protein
MNDINHDVAYLDRCCLLIEKKLNWRPSSEWRNYEFTALSEAILDTTGVNLSTTTLKRVFGKLKYDSLPSSVTLNALASYVGFASWMDFKSNAGRTVTVSIPLTKEKSSQSTRYWLVGIVGAVICALPFIFLSGSSSASVTDANAIIFTSKPLAAGLPNSVVFNVDLKENSAENIIIQQSWDSTKTIRVQKGQREATGIYYYPGFFSARLILDGKTVKQHPLFIKAERWMATIDHQPIPTYLKRGELTFDDQIGISEPVMASIRKLQTPTYLTYHLVRPFVDTHSDHFQLQATIKHIYSEGPAVCQTAKVFVLCSDGAFIIPFTIPGCVSDVNLKLNDNYLPGKSNDLSSFGADLSDWSDFKLVVENRRAKIFLGDKLIHESAYKKDAGDVVGIRFSFLGAGEVKNIKLINGKGKITYALISPDNP